MLPSAIPLPSNAVHPAVRALLTPWMLTAMIMGIGVGAAQASDAAPSTSAIAAASWEKVSTAFFQQIQADALHPSYLSRCQGLVVTPTGDLIIQTARHGICVSRDQGATWTIVPGDPIRGRCEHGFAFSVAYPYDGRLAFFCYDGQGKTSGGMSLDGAATWKPFTAQVSRGTEFGDVDWTERTPTTLYAITHEPWLSVASSDGGEHWLRLDPAQTGTGPDAHMDIGIIAGQVFVRFNVADHDGAIERSTDGGRTWSAVSTAYHVQGRHLVHYGPRVYWTTSQGVITSSDGATWTLTGRGAEGATYGPYFGSSQQEMVIVTDQDFRETADGGKTWTSIARGFVPPDIFHGSRGYSYFGWDAAHRLLYASGLAASIYRLRLAP